MMRSQEAWKQRSQGQALRQSNLNKGKRLTAHETVIKLEISNKKKIHDAQKAKVLEQEIK